MTSITVTKAREVFADIVNRATYRKERTVVTNHRKEVAAIVPIEDVQLLERLEELVDLREVEAALAEMEKTGTRPWAEVKKELGLE